MMQNQIKLAGIIALAISVSLLSGAITNSALATPDDFIEPAAAVAAPAAVAAQHMLSHTGKHTQKITPLLKKIAGLDVAIWLPPKVTDDVAHNISAPDKIPQSTSLTTNTLAPLVVLSHGINSKKTHFNFLTSAFARAGYIVIAPDHSDAYGHPQFLRQAQKPFLHASKWSDSTYKNRADDIQNLLDGLRTSEFGDQIDWSRVALVGHSLGGYTVLGMAGGWQSWPHPPVKAVLALSPYCAPYLLDERLKQIKIPTMYQGGTVDYALTPKLKGEHGAFVGTGAPCYFVEFKGAGHLAWTNFDHSKRRRDAITRYSLAFLDKYVRDQETNVFDETGKSVKQILVK